jgi:hypothetical protein
MLDAINTPTHVLSKDGKEQFRGTENNCYYKLQRLQGRSADWAMKYEGWKVTEAETFDSTKKN